MEAAEENQEQTKRDKLECQATDKSKAANLFRFACPVFRARNARTASLHEERNYVECNKDWSEASAGDTEYAVVGAR